MVFTFDLPANSMILLEKFVHDCLGLESPTYYSYACLITANQSRWENLLERNGNYESWNIDRWGRLPGA